MVKLSIVFVFVMVNHINIVHIFKYCSSVSSSNLKKFKTVGNGIMPLVMKFSFDF